MQVIRRVFFVGRRGKQRRGIRKETTDKIVCLAKIDSSDIWFKGP